MSDYILRDAAIEALRKLEQDDIRTYGCKIPEGFDATEAIEAIRELPGIEIEDAVSKKFMYKLGARCIAVRNENGVLVALASIESLPPIIPKPLDSVLDKIRAEIEKLIKMKKGLLPTCGDNTTWLIKKGEIVGLEQALLVVDAQREAKK